MQSENIIELGDIVKIIASSEHKLHDSSFYVTYVDPLTMIDLIHVGTMQLYSLPIVKGKLIDEDIKQIQVVNRSIHKGYCRQNGLFVNTWVTIDIGGDIPSIVTAQITNLEEDCITLITYPENDVLYLDFEYKGVPKYIPIQKICIRNQPSSYQNINSTPEEILDEAEEELVMYEDNGDIFVSIPENMKVDASHYDELHNMYNETQVEDIEEPYEYQVDASSRFVQYKLETQINHLLDDLLASVSDANRSDKVMRKIYTHIQRFQELRNQYSTYDSYGQISGYTKKNPLLHKPLVNSLIHMNNTVPWIKPVVSQYKKIYDVAKNDNSFDASVANTVLSLERDDTFVAEFMRVNYTNNDFVKYQGLQHELANLTRPFTYNWSSLDTLTDLDINKDMDLILSNNEHFQSTVVNMKRKTSVFSLFSISRYIDDYHYPSYDPRKRQTTMQLLMPKDRASVNSLLYMPSAFIDYTKTSLPGSTILDKSNLHLNPMFMYQLLTDTSYKKMNKQEIEINDTIDNEKTLHPLENTLRHIKLQPFQEHLQDKDKEKTYRMFLQQTIPSTFSIIHQYLKTNPAIYNLYDVMQSLEPFLIYQNDLSFKALDIIKYMLRDNIQSFVNSYQEKLQGYNRLKTIRFNSVLKKMSDVHFKLSVSLFNNNFETNNLFFTDYLIQEGAHTTSEIINKILLNDNGSLLFNVLQKVNIDLVSPNELITDDLDEDEEFIGVTKGMCLRKNLSKRYSNFKELQDDNDNRELEYDEEFDDTNYALLKEYKTEKDSMENEVFIDFLSEKLITKHKCPRSKGEEMAQTLVRGKKLVRDADYAILELRPQFNDGDQKSLSEKEKRQIEIESDIRKTVNYYRRVKHVWVYDKDIDENAFIDSNTLLCNIKEKCYKNAVQDNCESVKMQTEPRLRKQSKKEIIEEFSERYTEEIEVRGKRIDENIQKLRIRVDSIRDTEKNIRNMFDYERFFLGQNAVFMESKVSPYQYLHDIIIQPSFDFHKKQEFIVKLVLQYCREPLPDENPHWKYCLKTNAKLMENSLYQLAIAYHNEDYNKTLLHLCRTIGKEDGEFIYDKETGCVLKNIEYQEDANQDYNRTRDVDEDNLDGAFDSMTIDEKNAMEEETSLKQTKVYYYNGDTQYFFNILKSLCKTGEGIDVGIDDIQENVLQICTSLLTEKKIFMSEKVYNKQQEERKKQKNNPKSVAPSFKKYIATKKLEVLVSSTIVTVQCMIPSIKRRKTFPGCVQSFRGYPLDEGMDDLSTIKYFSCVLRKIAKDSDSSPWNTVPKKENVMEDRLKNIIEKFIVPHPYVKNILDKKRIYDREHKNDTEIPSELDVSKQWLRFTPIIVPYDVTSGKSPIRNVSEGFQQEIMATLKQGKKEQWDHIGVLLGKMDMFSAATLQSIKSIVNDQDPILMTVSKIPFLQNSCCISDKEFTTPLKYFENEDENIKKYIKQCNINALALRDVIILAKPYFLRQKLSNENITPYDKDSIQNTFKSYNDSLYYKAFIQYCFLDNAIMPIPQELKVICNEKPDNYNIKGSLEEKIDFLKNNGKRMSQTKLIEMMNFIHRRNCIHVKTYELNFRAEMKRDIMNIEELFTHYEKIPEGLSRFVEIFWNIFDRDGEDIELLEQEDEMGNCDDIDTSNEDSDNNEKKKYVNPTQQKYDQFINFVTPEIELMKTKLKMFLHDQNSTAFSSSKLELIFGKLFPEHAEYDYVNYCTFIKNFLYSLCIEYPLRITNYVNRNTQDSKAYNIPRQWPITENDSLNLLSYMDEVDRELDPFYQEPLLLNLMTHIQKLLKPISNILQFFYSFFPTDQPKLYVRLFQYLTLTVFILHIELAEETSISYETFKSVRQEEKDTNELSEMIEVDEFVPVDDISNSILQKLGDLFKVYLYKILSRKHQFTTLSYSDIMRRVDKSLEEEKHSIKEHFRLMSKEERRAELVMKSLHLGIFNVNNEKLISYGNNQDNLFGAVVSEQQEDYLEDQLIDRMMNNDDRHIEEVEMPPEENHDSFDEDPDEDMYDITENAYEQNFDD